MKKHLLIGTTPPPNHGQAIAFQKSIDAIKENKLNYKVIESTFKNKNGKISFSLFLKYFINVFISYIKYKPDIIYFLCSRTLFGSLRDVFVLFIYYFSDVVIVNHIHGATLPEFIESLPLPVKYFYKKLYNRINKHIVLNAEMKQQLTGFIDVKKIYVVNNFYPNSFDSYEHEEKLKKSFVNLVYLSSVCKTKGIFDLLDAIDMFKDTGTQFSLTIAGGILGDYEYSKNETDKLFKRLIYKKKYINYIGEINEEDKVKLLHNSDIFILPTYHRSEAIPLSIIEAMRAGCVIISTKHNYIPTLIKNDYNGFLCEINSPDDLLESLNKAINTDNFEEISKKNILYAINNYSENIYKENIVKLLN